MKGKQLDSRASQRTTIGITTAFIMTAIASLRTRGLRRTLLFVALGIGLPVTFEYYSINNRHILRHHLQPQFKGVPIGIALAWYAVGYNTFTMVESLMGQLQIPAALRRLLLPIGTAVTATSLDLLADVAFLDQGYWEWEEDGSYAHEVVGANGKRGIPAVNYTGWLALTSGVPGAFLALGGGTGEEKQSTWSARAGRVAALFLLPSYLMSVGWELSHGRYKYILYSALFPVVLILDLLGLRPRK